MHYLDSTLSSPMVLVYLAFVGLLNLFLAVVWNRSDFVNVVLKITFVVVSLWTAYFFFTNLPTIQPL